MAAIESSDTLSSPKGGDLSLTDLQHCDHTLTPCFYYLEDGILPDKEPEARELLLSKIQYTVVDGTLYYSIIEKDKILRVTYTKKLLDELHSKRFAGHL